MMMRIVYMFIALTYSIGVTGMHVNLHWCSGELASLKINTLNHGSCGCDEESEADDCCADAGIYFKVDNTHSASAGTVIPAFVAVFQHQPLVSTLRLELIDEKFRFNYLLKDDLPPPDLLKKHCCFLI